MVQRLAAWKKRRPRVSLPLDACPLRGPRACADPGCPTSLNSPCRAGNDCWGKLRADCVLCADRQSLRLTAAKGYFPECEFSAAIRRENDPVSVRSPGQAFDEPSVVGDLPQSTFCRENNIKD